MAGSLHEKFLARFQARIGGRNRRSLAANGSEADRMALIALPNLDQETLVILAKRGPQVIRLRVASHPCLTAETARRIRVQDPEFRDAITERFGALLLDEIARETRAELVPFPPVVEVEEEFVEQPNTSAAQPPVVVPASNQHELAVDVGDEVEALATASDHLLDIEEDFDFDDRDLDLAFDLLEAASEPDVFEPPVTRLPSRRDVDDVITLQVIEIFERVPKGKAGEALLSGLSGKAGAPQLRSLIKLRDEGWEVDEVSVIWQARSNWNESHGIGPFDWPLTYGTVAKLAGSLPQFPDVDDLLYYLELIEEKWKRVPGARRTSRNAYINQWVSAYADGYRAGGHYPIDFLLEG